MSALSENSVIQSLYAHNPRVLYCIVLRKIYPENILLADWLILRMQIRIELSGNVIDINRIFKRCHE